MDAPAPSAPTAAPTGGAPTSAPAPSGPGPSGAGPGITPAGSGSGPVGAPSGQPAAPAAPQQPKRDPWMRKVAIGEGDARQEHELDLSEHLAEWRHKVKVDGSEMEVGISDLVEMYPLAQGAQKRFVEAAKQRKEAAAMVETFNKQREALRGLLKTPETAFQVLEQAFGGAAQLQRALEDKLASIYEYEKMTPDQRRQADQRRDAETAYQRRDRELREREQRIQQQEQTAHKANVDQTFAKLQKSVPAALESAGLVATPHTIDLFAQVKQSARASGVQMTDAQAAAIVKREVEALVGGFAKNPVALRGVLGDQGVEAIRQAELQRIEDQPGRRAQRAEPQVQARRPEQPQKRMTLEEFREERRREHEEELQRRLSGGR